MLRRIEARFEGAQTGIDSLAAFADRVLERLARKWQSAGPGKGTKQARRNNRALIDGQLLHIGQYQSLRSDFSVFSDTASARWVDPINTVRSGVTNPRKTARPTSIISAAIRISTSPADGARAKTGS